MTTGGYGERNPQVAHPRAQTARYRRAGERPPGHRVLETYTTDLSYGEHHRDAHRDDRDLLRWALRRVLLPWNGMGVRETLHWLLHRCHDDPVRAGEVGLRPPQEQASDHAAIVMVAIMRLCMRAQDYALVLCLAFTFIGLGGSLGSHASLFQVLAVCGLFGMQCASSWDELLEDLQGAPQHIQGMFQKLLKNIFNI